MTPPPRPVDRNAAGRSSSSTSQSSISVSTSVQPGLLAHNMPCTPSPAERSSPRMAGPDALPGKKAKNRGDCQWVMPGSAAAPPPGTAGSAGGPGASSPWPEQPQGSQGSQGSNPPQPGYGQPGTPPPPPPPYGQPQYGQPQYGQPQYGQPQYGQYGYGQPPYGQPAYGHYGYQAPQSTNGMAIASLVCAFVCAPLGIVFGIVAKQPIRRTGPQAN